MDQSEIDDKTGMFYFIISCVLSLTSRPTKQNLRKERKKVEKTFLDLPFDASALCVTAESNFEDISIAQ